MAAQLTDVQTMFHIGAVARMTGLSAEIIRAWERRYGVVAPNRTPTRHRLYTRQDIARLALIKSLVEAGDRIGAVGGLSIEQLHQRLNTHRHQRIARTQPSRRGAQRVAVLGDVLPARLERYQAQSDDLEFVLMARDRLGFEAEIKKVRPHVIVLEYPTVHEETDREIHALLDESGAGKAFVIYGFGSQRVVARLDNGPITPLRAPVDLPELRHLILAASAKGQIPIEDAASAKKPALAPAGEQPPVPQRRYSDEDLALIASAATPVRCECPYHLVDLIRSLVAFEAYSEQCENREPDDARLHAFLHASTARARALLETALDRIAKAENIAVP